MGKKKCEKEAKHTVNSRRTEVVICRLFTIPLVDIPRNCTTNKLWFCLHLLVFAHKKTCFVSTSS